MQTMKVTEKQKKEMLYLLNCYKSDIDLCKTGDEVFETYSNYLDGIHEKINDGEEHYNFHPYINVSTLDLITKYQQAKLFELEFFKSLETGE